MLEHCHHLDREPESTPSTKWYKCGITNRLCVANKRAPIEEGAGIYYDDSIVRENCPCYNLPQNLAEVVRAVRNSPQTPSKILEKLESNPQRAERLGLAKQVGDIRTNSD